MNEKAQDRQSNFELMRIVSMFMIVVWHIILHSNLLSNSTGTIHILLMIIVSICLVHVNSFVLLTGYFQCEKRFKANSFLKILNSYWFYKAVIMIIFIILDIVSINTMDKIFAFLPISYNWDYWFITCYLLLYLISPILNVVIRNSDKRQLKKYIILMFLIASVLSTITAQTGFANNNGYSLTNFILLYFIGAYLKKYPIRKNNIFKEFSDSAQRFIFFILFIFIAIVRVLGWNFGEQIVNYGTVMNYIGNFLCNAKMFYDTPLIIIQTILYFAIFTTFNLKNKFVNFVAKYVFGIYLVSDNVYIRQVLYTKIFDIGNYPVVGKRIFVKIFAIAVVVFVVCLIIDIIRQLLFKIIYNRKWAKKFRDWYQKKIELLGITVNW